MAILRHLLGRAARYAASDPRTQEKAKTFLRDEVAPRAREAARQGRDAYGLVRDDWRESGQPGRADGAGEDSTARRAGRFLGKLHNRLNQEPK